MTGIMTEDLNFESKIKYYWQGIARSVDEKDWLLLTKCYFGLRDIMKQRKNLQPKLIQEDEEKEVF